MMHSTKNPGGTQRITMSDLHELLPRLGKKDLVLDVRSAAEYAAGHVPGSKNIPHTEIAHHQDELKAFDQIYVYCQAGVRAQYAVSVLEGLGFQNLICIPSTGMGHWIASQYPVEK